MVSWHFKAGVPNLFWHQGPTCGGGGNAHAQFTEAFAADGQEAELR